MKIKFKKQFDSMDCGVACLHMIAQYYGKFYAVEKIREICHVTKKGLSLMGLSDAAEKLGFRTVGAKITFDQLQKESALPAIAHWNKKHFIIIEKVTHQKVWAIDPSLGPTQYSKEEFMKSWGLAGCEELGVCLFLEPSTLFYEISGEKQDNKKFSILLGYLRPYYQLIGQLFAGLLFGSVLQLAFPFLTQAIVDKGINNHDYNFVYLVLIAQIVIFLSRTSVDFIRSWIMLHISTRINVALISDFLIKLLKLPISFFDSKVIGDIIQRIHDHQRVENFLTTSTISVLFSMLNFLVFGCVLLYYSLSIFTVFLIGSLLYLCWFLLFMRKRRFLDFQRFEKLAENQSHIFELITGVQEIKLNNCENQKRWKWEHIQAKLFKVNMKSLALEQYQKSGSLFINQLKNILISFLSAKMVIEGQMTLGMMMAIQYLIGQLNGPIEQMLSFFQTAQDAKISLERIGEIHNQNDEEERTENRLNQLPNEKSIHLSNVSFQYDGPNSPQVVKDLDLKVEAGKMTAIVGASGSGKTTLLKLMMGFYQPTDGQVTLGGSLHQTINTKLWRDHCGAVLQDGFIFSDTIANNIALEEEKVDLERLYYAVKMANIQGFIESLPQGYNTRIGIEGQALSQGQRQRILIARVIYKNPDFIFFDEATNALDANNELVIIQNLNQFFQNKTVVVVAHRLSTVKNADSIVVLDHGKIVESGTHEELASMRGAYYRLIKNQLELGA